MAVQSFRTPEQDARTLELLEREEEATGMLRASGAFRRGSGVRSPRSEREARWRAQSWDPWVDDTVEALGCAEIWDELDAVAATARLSPDEKAILGMSVVGGYSLRQIGRLLRLTFHEVRQHRQSAVAKCRGRAGHLPYSARTLFWDEIRQKRASIYRAPYRGRRGRRV